MSIIGKRNLAGIAFIAIAASLLIEVCITMTLRFGEVDWSAAILSVGFTGAPIGLAAMLACSVSDRQVAVAAWLLAFGAFAVAVWLNYVAWSSRSSTAVIALVFWPIIEISAIIGCLALVQLSSWAIRKRCERRRSD
ncbi:MAG: hypothetical protein C0476_05185 [Sphingomonas sp.]|nr:hypothetical protein [Sphingomonas sp.]